ncbi:hypothetical protein C1646_665049 [Rhizophagus diaphanus]|nr:hypothetical protein C1646_665049 [Rhizophagus diaphanus] [Rhizophagus sp. MUCL 43196]
MNVQYEELGGDLEIEEIAIAGGRKAVRERFEIKDDLIVHSKKIVITRRTVSVRQVRRLLSYQKEPGCFELDNHLAETLDFSSAEEAKKREEWVVDKYQITSKWITEQEIEDEIKSENGAIVTKVIIGLLKIKIKIPEIFQSQVYGLLQKPDPYVRILDASGQEIVRTLFISTYLTRKTETVESPSLKRLIDS